MRIVGSNEDPMAVNGEKGHIIPVAQRNMINVDMALWIQVAAWNTLRVQFGA